MSDYRVQPDKSKKQHDFMEAVAHSPEFAKKAGVSQDVGKEFTDADKAEGKYQSSQAQNSTNFSSNVRRANSAGRFRTFNAPGRRFL